MRSENLKVDEDEETRNKRRGKVRYIMYTLWILLYFISQEAIKTRCFYFVCRVFEVLGLEDWSDLELM